MENTKDEMISALKDKLKSLDKSNDFLEYTKIKSELKKILREETLSDLEESNKEENINLAIKESQELLTKEPTPLTVQTEKRLMEVEVKTDNTENSVDDSKIEELKLELNSIDRKNNFLEYSSLKAKLKKLQKEEPSNSTFNQEVKEENSVPSFDEVVKEENSIPSFDEEVKEETSIPSFDEEVKEETSVPTFNEEVKEETSVPSFNEEVKEETSVPSFEEEVKEETSVPSFEEVKEETSVPSFNEEVKEENSIPSFEELKKEVPELTFEDVKEETFTPAGKEELSYDPTSLDETSGMKMEVKDDNSFHDTNFEKEAKENLNSEYTKSEEFISNNENSINEESKTEVIEQVSIQNVEKKKGWFARLLEKLSNLFK